MRGSGVARFKYLVSTSVAAFGYVRLTSTIIVIIDLQLVFDADHWAV